MMHLDQCAEETSSLIKLLLQFEKEPSTRHTHTSKTIARSFSHSTRAYTTAARTATSSSVCEVLGISRQSLEKSSKASFLTFAKSASTTCNLLSSRYHGHRWTQMTPSRSWRTRVLISRVCDPVYRVMAQKGFRR
jgi:hypothetical protein